MNALQQYCRSAVKRIKSKFPYRSGRCPKNPAEAAFFKTATEAGWVVTKRGWPDFFCFRGEELALVEVKPPRGKLKREQEIVLRSLSSFGVPCYRWSPDTGYQKLCPLPRSSV